MGFATRLGKHVRISARKPQAAAQCDRCGMLHQHVNLRWQHDYAGAGLINKRLLVCSTCEDIPQMQNKAIILPADPVPIKNPRIPDWATAAEDNRITQGETVIDPLTGIPTKTGDTRVTQANDVRVVQERLNLMAKKARDGNE